MVRIVGCSVLLTEIVAAGSSVYQLETASALAVGLTVLLLSQGIQGAGALLGWLEQGPERGTIEERVLDGRSNT